MSVSPVVAYGLCQCGCGEKAPLVQTATFTLGQRTRVKGQPQRFVHGHHARTQGCAIITPVTIAFLQGWLRSRFCIEAGLVIERSEGERTRVALRFTEESYMYECDVRTLNALRKRDPQAPKSQVLLLFEQAS